MHEKNRGIYDITAWHLNTSREAPEHEHSFKDRIYTIDIGSARFYQ